MDATVLGTAIGLTVLVIAGVFAIGHYRRERLRNRVIGDMQQRRLYDLNVPKH
ncbi:MAG: hypothetical protein WCA85_22730 [Paraburkholderia sp.]|uniref:hypothetical protein n=1 Tax=Paraburkholderia sp. TaxID=1926495 RepID=UPI003C409065